jgi:hypothetical protein
MLNLQQVLFPSFTLIDHIGHPGNCRDSTSIRPRQLSFKYFPIHRSSIVLPIHAILSSYQERCEITHIYRC